MATTTGVSSGAAILATECNGRGDLVVFLHAGVADRRMWRNELDYLSRADPPFRAVAYDRRGFGDTLHADEPWSHVRDLLAVLDATAGDVPATLVGCSQGGRIAIDAALAHPKRVRALVLVAPAISGAPDVETFPPAIERWLTKMEKAEAAADVDAINELEAHAWLDGPLARQGRVRGAARELFLAMNDIALRSEKRGVEAEPAPAYPRLAEIDAPTLVVWGDLDFPHVVQQCQRLVRTLPKAEGRRIDGTAHFPNLERPETFDELVLAFCRRAR